MAAATAPRGARRAAAKISRSLSLSSVLEEDTYSSDGGDSLSSPRSPVKAPTVLELTLAAATAAVVSPTTPLPAHVADMLSQLFPSCAALQATGPSPDGLGLQVCRLLGGNSSRSAPVAGAGELQAPLPEGGTLAFSLMAPPSQAELQLMEAFCQVLAASLAAIRPLQRQASLPTAPTTPGGSALPNDCFWEAC